MAKMAKMAKTPRIVRSWRAAAAVLTVTLAASGAAAASSSADASSGAPYPCPAGGGPNFTSGVDASAIGWLGNGQGATACLGGSFYVPNGIDTTYGFGVYNDSPTTWTNADGYLPARDQLHVGRGEGLRHELRRPRGDRRQPVRLYLQPRGSAQPDQPDADS